MTLLITILSFLVAIGVLVAVHEFGHCFGARYVGGDAHARGGRDPFTLAPDRGHELGVRRGGHSRPAFRSRSAGGNDGVTQ